ncbi:diguanylate cyclase [Porphyrobacter sp. SLTP]|uniref:GGDEF domain-containing protein n=1 Tax=Porphyrobacter sp. SLTP TaxID=2683266 RepID=UPI001411B687|nr:GGDEF domain-containing protein [Porphyrobacter sp. SLTP]NBB24196.1 diguanylate cyclase [Porphyrobacter sp. SLTP]
MHVPKAVAEPVLTACALIIIILSNVASEVSFGPFLLVICAFGAWFLGNRFALLLSLFVASTQILNGHAPALEGSPLIMVLKFLSVLAVVLMLGVARAALELEWRYARVDQLTGALNRKAFFEAIESGGSRTGLTVLVYADVDGLKLINDQFGHDAGDRALGGLAHRIKSAIRKDDIFARIGGDEFAIILKVRDAHAAELVAKRLNDALNLDPLKGEVDIRCSLGVLVLPQGSKSIDAELKQADTLMYHAKKAQVGMMMAISIEGDMQAFAPPASSTSSDGQQRAAVRSARRATGLARSDDTPEGTLAA